MHRICGDSISRETEAKGSQVPGQTVWISETNKQTRNKVLSPYAQAKEPRRKMAEETGSSSAGSKYTEM